VFTSIGNVDVRRTSVEGEHKLITNLPGPASHLLPTSIRSAGAVLAAGAGDHLYVLDTDKRLWRYLGYGSLQEGHQQISPSGHRVAWRDARGHAYVHDHRTGQTRALLTTAGTNAGLFFASDDRVLGFYSPQRVVMFDAESGAVVGEIAGTLSQAQIGGGYLLVPYPGTLYKITDDGFQNVAMLRSFTTFSRLVKVEDRWQLLALASKDSKARLIDLEEAASMTPDKLEKRPVFHRHITASTLVDDRGRPYNVSGNKTSRMDADGQAAVYYELPTARSGRIVSVSPGGKRVAVTTNLDIYFYDGDSGSKLWSRANAYPTMNWSRDGKRALVAARGGLGFEVVDASTGKTLWKMCGHSFRASPAPPIQRRNNHQRMANLCAR
jgi:hypothetical protein